MRLTTKASEERPDAFAARGFLRLSSAARAPGEPSTPGARERIVVFIEEMNSEIERTRGGFPREWKEKE